MSSSFKYDKIAAARETFAQRLRMLRTENNLTQQHMANLFHISKAAYSNWELAKRLPDPIMVINISKHFGVSSDFLFGRSKYRNDVLLDEKFVDRCKFLDMTVLCKESRRSLLDFYEFLLSKEHTLSKEKTDEIHRYIKNFKMLEKARDVKA